MTLGFGCIVRSTVAQDDPFGFGGFDAAPAGDPLSGVGNPFGTAPSIAAPAAAGALATDGTADPLTVELRTLAGGTPRQLGLAIREAIRLRKWKEIDLILGNDRIGNLDSQARLQVASRIGSRFLVRGLTATEIAPASTAALEQLNTTLTDNAVDPARLEAAIDDLGSADQNTQLRAVRVLLSGGDAAVQSILKAIVRQQPKPKLRRLVDVLAAFGQPATDAVELLAVFGSDAVRGGALNALQSLDREQALPALVTAAVSPLATDAEKDIATGVLSDWLGAVPNRGDAMQFMAGRLNLAQQSYAASGPEQPAETVWMMTEDRSGVEATIISATSAAARKAANTAEMIRRIGGIDRRLLIDALTADLRNRYLADLNFGTAEDFDRLVALWGPEATDIDLLGEILLHSLGGAHQHASSKHPTMPAAGDPAVAIATIRLLAAIGDPSVVIGKAGQLAPLVQAVSHPLALVRFEAANAIGTLQPKNPYAGSNRVLDRWIEMAAIGDSPIAIVLINDAAIRMAVNQRLTMLGFVVRQVATVRDLIAAVDAGGDLQLIVSTTRAPDFSTIETIDRVRRRPLGGAAPIILIGEKPSGYEQIHHRWNADQILITGSDIAEPKKLTMADVIADFQSVWSDSSVELSQVALSPAAIGDAPIAVVLINDAAIRLAVNQRLTKLGFFVRQVATVGELITAMDAGGDLQLIVSTTRAPDVSTIEMIDRVRRRPRGGAAPIILVDGKPGGQGQFQHRWNADQNLITDSDLVEPKKLTPAEMVAKLQAVWSDLAVEMSQFALSPADREIFAVGGLMHLARLSENANSSNIYQWRDRETDLIEASRRSGFGDASLELLGQLGSRTTQDLLSRLVINQSIPLATRQKAATFLVDSIARSGTRLSRSQALEQYDRYNEAQDLETQKLLGLILDAIELRAGVVSKP
jgi:CheY-like chemotaxis protein